MQKLNEDFYTSVNVGEIASRLNLDESAVEMIFVYWKLKRKVCMIYMIYPYPVRLGIPLNIEGSV
jgi:hypothetical protein